MAVQALQRGVALGRHPCRITTPFGRLLSDGQLPPTPAPTFEHFPCGCQLLIIITTLVAACKAGIYQSFGLGDTRLERVVACGGICEVFFFSVFTPSQPPLQ